MPRRLPSTSFPVRNLTVIFHSTLYSLNYGENVVKQTTKTFEVHTAASMKMIVFWDIALMMEAVRTSESSVCFNETTRRYMPEGCHFHLQITKTHVDDSDERRWVADLKKSIGIWTKRHGMSRYVPLCQLAQSAVTIKKRKLKFQLLTNTPAISSCSTCPRN
jgi:hypothetical protein